MIKLTGLILILFFFAQGSSAEAEQSASEIPVPPDIKILDSGMISVAKDPSKFGVPPTLENPVPQPGPGEEWDRIGGNRKLSGPDHYEIHITIKNTGTNTVKSIDWQYSFLDSDGDQELKRFRVRSKKKIPPNGMGILTKAFMPILASSEDPRPEFAKGKQKVVILRVIYADDSTWEAGTGTKPKP
jgi:hypothetical protein